MKLTPRLHTIVQFVNKEASVADIGTDHGYIPVYLIQHEIASRVIASDVNEGPLQSARNTIEANGLEHSIEVRLGSGLEVLSLGEVDTVIIAGMGGFLIRDILEANLTLAHSVDRLILQPMVAQDELRRWLLENQFEIVDERLAKEEHRIYEVLLVRKGIQTISDEIYYDIGIKMIENRDPLLHEFIKKHIRKNAAIVESLERKTNKHEEGIAKAISCKKKLKKLEEVLRWLNKEKNSSK
ncbi:MAG: class I SAM-dependent methyltransferase [Thermotaleaceae bacterium]